MTKKVKNIFEGKKMSDADNDDMTSQVNDSSEKQTDANELLEEESEQTESVEENISEEKSQTNDTLINELYEKLAAADETNREMQDKYLRLSAEFDNYRKRTLKEKMDLTKQANGDLLKDILSVIDDFERGMQNVDKSEDIDALRAGIHLIYNKFIEFIRQNGVKEIESKDLDFDIDFHEALTKIPAPTEELKGKVVEVIEKGYMLNDKVLRYSKVVVGE